METKTIILALIILLLFILLLIGIVYIMIRASLRVEDIVKVEQLSFLDWVAANCFHIKNQTWVYGGSFYTNEELIIIYNNLEDE